jgi:hypothetical protein
MVELIQEIKACAGEKLSLPNGVAVLNEGIVVADGGNNRVCLLDIQGKVKESIGGLGFGKYRFREPVGVFVSPKQEVYVTDWHNHRVVVYDRNLKYLTEFGHYSELRPSSSVASTVRRVIEFFRRLAYVGSYIPQHFLSDKKPKGLPTYSLSLLVNGLAYWYQRNGSISDALRMMTSSYDAMNKPNGVAFYKDQIVISQKNSRCLSVYHSDEVSKTYLPISHHFGPSDEVLFGRLGNITYGLAGYLYVCDERQGVIWKLNSDFDLSDSIRGHDSGLGQFLPFSCCLLNEDLLCVCGGLNFQMIDLRDKSMVYCSEDIGELHSVAYDQSSERLYIADRSNALIRVYQLKLQG